MKNQQVVAIAILVVVVIWMVIPRNAADTDEAPSSNNKTVVAIPEGLAVDVNTDVLTVRASRIEPQSHIKQLRVRGRTEASRHVEVRAEEAGRIVSEPVARGARVAEGDVLCEIAVDNRDANLQEALSRREQAEFEYKASLDLQERRLQSGVIVAQLKAARESAIAGVMRAELALAKTRMRAPFAGVVETRTVEIGDLLNTGTVCASVLDDTPMLLIGLVPEQNVSTIEVGARVTAQLLDGEIVSGTVSFLARAADPVSRSYRIEVEVDAQYTDIREGITAELLVNSATIDAHLIPSSALTLDDNGSIGVKLIGPDNIVSFENVEIVGDNTSQLNPGIWVSGLTGPVNLITVGQEIVFPGQLVETSLSLSR